MKSFIVFALFVAAAVAAPASSDSKEAVIVNQQLDNIGVEGYKFSFETSNKIQQAEQGQVKNAGTENEALEVTGQFSYIGDDGIVYLVKYTADEFGFHPQGAHLPVAPQ